MDRVRFDVIVDYVKRHHRSMTIHQMHDEAGVSIPVIRAALYKLGVWDQGPRSYTETTIQKIRRMIEAGNNRVEIVDAEDVGKETLQAICLAYGLQMPKTTKNGCQVVTDWHLTTRTIPQELYGALAEFLDEIRKERSAKHGD